jgi:hypothetical protein
MKRGLPIALVGFTVAVVVVSLVFAIVVSVT